MTNRAKGAKGLDRDVRRGLARRRAGKSLTKFPVQLRH